jgi:hypothetical protein
MSFVAEIMIQRDGSVSVTVARSRKHSEIHAAIERARSHARWLRFIRTPIGGYPGVHAGEETLPACRL